jgi:hypothetical protein
MDENLSQILARCGRYVGRATAHDGAAFVGELELEAAAGGSGAWLRFVATGEDGTTFHAETTLLGIDGAGGLSLWSLNSNSRRLLAQPFLRREARAGEPWLVFGLGAPSDRTRYRNEISIGLHADGSLTYAYAWGLPQGDFADRSSVRMVPASTSRGALVS